MESSLGQHHPRFISRSSRTGAFESSDRFPTLARRHQRDVRDVRDFEMAYSSTSETEGSVRARWGGAT